MSVTSDTMPPDEESPDWIRKKRSPFFRDWGFSDVDKMFEDIEKMMEKQFEDFTSRVPKDYVRERKLPDGSTTREWGPFVYGYSVKIGPDGKPEVHEFGNVKPGLKGPQVSEEREPLVDIVETNGNVQVVAELPGVDKKDIKLTATEEELTISVESPERKYFKRVAFPVKVRVREAKTQYKNGVLEVMVPKVEQNSSSKGEPLRID